MHDLRRIFALIERGEIDVKKEGILKRIGELVGMNNELSFESNDMW